MDSVRDAAERARGVLPDQGSFGSRLHEERVAAVLGMALGVSFTICFLTGLWSHLVQHPTDWFTWPARPAGLYRVTQGLHVTTGIVSIPLLLAKLWAVYPHFWSRPAVRNAAHAVERLSLLPLVAGSVFLLFTGVANIAYWYDPLGFYFPAGHFWAAWITIGALVIHIGAKLTVTRRVLARTATAESGSAAPSDGLSRRGLLTAVGATAGVLVLATVGQTIAPLRRLSVLAPRRPDRGVQGYPVNRTASQAGVEEVAANAGYRLTVDGAVARPLSMSYEELAAMPQHEATLPISCVEGWSFSARWRGVRVRDLLEAAGADVGEVRVESLQEGGRYRTSPLNGDQVADGGTLLALELDGQPLDLDHGFPVRLIAPNRPGVQQTKWVSHVEVL